jgi:outer membrane protein TolC
MEEKVSGIWFKIIAILIFTFTVLSLCASDLSDKQESELFKDTLSIDQCIKIAILNSPEIKISQGNVIKSELNVNDARAEFLPEISLNGGYFVNNTYSQFEWNRNHYDLGISASINPFSSGRTYLGKEIAEANLSQSRDGYRLTEMNLIMEVIRRYYNLLKANQILELREQTIDQRKKELEFSKTQFDLGLVAMADTLKARVALEGARVNLHEAKGKLMVSRAELNEVMGLALDILISIKSVEMKERNIPELDSILNIAYNYRPDVKQQKSSISADKYNLMLARLNRLPTLTVTGGYNLNAERFAFEGLPLNKTNWDNNSEWSFGVGISFPIFDGGVKSRAITKANIELKNAELRYENLSRLIELEVKSAHINLVNASQRIELTERQVISAEESYKAALGRYMNGIAPITEVTDAEVAFTESRVNQINSKYDFLEAEALLKNASGVLYIPEEVK